MISVSTLMCHAPIVIPDVAGVRGEQCVHSTAAMRAAAARVVQKHPDVVVVLSPHTPRLPGFGIVAGVGRGRTGRITGSFEDFGAPAVQIDLPAAEDATARLLHKAEQAGADVSAIALGKLDHGAAVPLAFLVEAGFCGPTLVVGLPRAPSAEGMRAFGRLLAEAAGDERWAVVASGDCSHRLIPGAPAGFHPEAQRFDDALVRVVTAGERLEGIDAGLRDLAAEDVVDTVQIAEAASGSTLGREVLSYEGPFGVGYLVAVLCDPDPAPSFRAKPGADPEERANVLVDVAEDALRAHLERRGRRAFDTGHVDAMAVSGAFVTWREGRDLRGCVGRMTLDKPLSEAVAELAVSSASADPRFLPVTAAEAPRLDAEITLLSPSEHVNDVGELDPRTWGVEAKNGWRHGVLLPDIDGVDSVEQQLNIVLRKAGIRPDEPFTLRKFRAQKVTKKTAEQSA